MSLFLENKALPQLSINFKGVGALIRLACSHMPQGTFWVPPACSSSWRTPFPIVCFQFHVASDRRKYLGFGSTTSDRRGFTPALNTTGFLIWGKIHSDTTSLSIKKKRKYRALLYRALVILRNTVLKHLAEQHSITDGQKQ